MDFSVVFQLRSKKFWWMDVIFYFVVALLIATVVCYFIFLTKNSLQRDEIKKETLALETVGTAQQKSYESDVIKYQAKISDFSNLLKNHEFDSNVLAFMRAQTMPNIWYKQFSLDEKSNSIQLSGESDDLDAFSRQVAVFERNKYVKSIGTLNSSLGGAAKVQFNINLVLDESIFDYISGESSDTNATAPIDQPAPAAEPNNP